MKKKLLTTMLLTAMVASVFNGCGKTEVKQTKESVTFEAGSEFAFDVSDYFAYTNDKAIKKEDFTLDASSVDTSKVGEYEVTVTFGDKNDEDAQVFTVKVTVEDTIAPEVAFIDTMGEYTYINSLTSDDNFASLITVDDKTETKVTASYEKLGDAEEVTDEVIEKYLAIFNGEEVEEEEVEESTEETEEVESTEDTDEETVKTEGDGFYRMVLTATDEGKNETSVEFLAIFDGTMPVVIYDGKEVADGDVIASADASKVAIFDEMSGEFTENDFEFNYDEENKTVAITVGDKAGNMLEMNLTVEESKNTTSASGSSNGGSASQSANANTSNKPAIMIEQPGLDYGNSQQIGLADPILAGFVTTSNGYTFYIEEAESFIRIAINGMEHIYTPYVDHNNTWVCIADSEAQANQILTNYVQSIYGSEFTATGYQIGGYYCDKTMAHHVNVYKNGEFVGYLETNNTVVYGGNVIYTP